MIETEKFAKGIRDAGAEWAEAERQVAIAEAGEKKTNAKLMLTAQIEHGCKTVAAQSTWADQQDAMEDARIQKGVAKGLLAAAKSNYLASEVSFKTWQTIQASTRMEKRVYSS
jgi:hypothetical protein